VRLVQSRLARTTGGRLGRVAAWLLLVLYGGGALAQRFTEAVPADVLGYAPSAARTAAWLAAGPIALAAAHGRERRDTEEGIVSLAGGLGVRREALRGARLLASIRACTTAVAIPAVGTALVAAALQPAPLDAVGALRAVPALAVFSVLTGVVLALAAAIADRTSPARGRSALAALVIVPWILADAAGWAGASIPGALDAVLTSSLDLVGLARLG
jgi:hypothetical protein